MPKFCGVVLITAKLFTLQRVAFFTAVYDIIKQMKVNLYPHLVIQLQKVCLAVN